MNSIAERLTRAREVAGLSQVELARRAGVSPGTIGNIEAGARKNPRELLAIARAAGVNAEWLKTGRGPREVRQRIDDAGISLAHEVSRAAPMMELPALSWENLMPSALPELFRLTLQDDAMAPEFPKGMEVILSTREASEPRARDAVLVADDAGAMYFRAFQAHRPGRWRAVALAEGYEPLDSEGDGLRVLAVCVGKLGRRG